MGIQRRGPSFHHFSHPPPSLTIFSKLFLLQWKNNHFKNCLKVNGTFNQLVLNTNSIQNMERWCKAQNVLDTQPGPGTSLIIEPLAGRWIGGVWVTLASLSIASNKADKHRAAAGCLPEQAVAPVGVLFSPRSSDKMHPRALCHEPQGTCVGKAWPYISSLLHPKAFPKMSVPAPLPLTVGDPRTILSSYPSLPHPCLTTVAPCSLEISAKGMKWFT